MNASPFNLHLFQPHLLLPSQQDRSRTLTAEQALLEGIVEEAGQCLTGTAILAGRGKCSAYAFAAAKYQAAAEALAWFLSDSTSTQNPVSFLYCCQHLNMSPYAIRQAARRLFAQLKKPQPPEKTLYVSEIRAYLDVTQNIRRRVRDWPSWAVRVRLRWSGYHGRIVKYINLGRFEETREAANSVAQSYIDSGAWKQFVEQLKEAA